MDLIPIVVGVTGHRNTVDKDKAELKNYVAASLDEVRSLCKSQAKGGQDTPIVMLNGFAQGADMLCAEVAFDMGIDVYAVLPCAKEKYLESFDNEADKSKLLPYLERAKRVILAPDMEQNRTWMQENGGIDDASYEYRQLGIYIAEHSHVLIALWDGKPPKTQFGCGTAEVVGFALGHRYMNREHLFSPAAVNDSAVIWIKSRRQGDGSAPDVSKRWVSCGSGNGASEAGKAAPYAFSADPPDSLREIVAKTVKYNERPFTLPENAVKLWDAPQELDAYRDLLRYHYAKADDRSYRGNQTKYTLFLQLLAILAALVAFTFLIYDDASLPYMIFPCTFLIAAIVVLDLIGKKKAYHGDYIDFRAFAEALRIQFYLSVCVNETPITESVCGLYAWAQKMEFAWIEKALRSLAVLYPAEKISIDPSRAVEMWIGTHEKPTGQLKYHRDKIGKNAAMAKRYEALSNCMLGVTLALYAAILILEIVSYACGGAGKEFFWNGNLAGEFSWRNFGGILLGSVAAASLLFSSFWGKLSYDRKASDNEKMGKFYAAAYERWQAVKDRPQEERKAFLKEIAREEIVENGIWYSYVNENRLEIDV